MIDDELLSLAARLHRPRTVVRAMSRVAAPAAAGCALMWVLALGTLALMRDPGGVALVNGLPAVVGPLPVGVLAWAAVMAVAATAGLTLLLPTLVIMTAGSLLTHSVPFLPALRVALRYRRALLALAGLGAAAGAGVTVVLTSVESFWPKASAPPGRAVVRMSRSFERMGRVGGPVRRVGGRSSWSPEPYGPAGPRPGRPPCGGMGPSGGRTCPSSSSTGPSSRCTGPPRAGWTGSRGCPSPTPTTGEP
ncbi:hypothetical protein ACWEPC_57890, partial [Nonomuraea sp. NPDC004297]